MNEYVRSRHAVAKNNMKCFSKEKSFLQYHWSPARRFQAATPTVVYFIGYGGELPTSPKQYDDWNILWIQDKNGLENLGSWFFGAQGNDSLLNSLRNLISGFMLSHLINPNRVVFAGRGMGGHAALYFSCQYPRSYSWAHDPTTNLLDSTYVRKQYPDLIESIFGNNTDHAYRDLRALLREHHTNSRITHSKKQTSSFYLEHYASIESLGIEFQNREHFTFEGIFSFFKTKFAKSEPTGLYGYELTSSAPALVSDLTVALNSRTPYLFKEKIEFSVDPFNDRSWRFWLQNLSWLPKHLEALPVGDRVAQCDHVIQQWFSFLQSKDSNPEFFYHDHSLAYRAMNLIDVMQYLTGCSKMLVRQHLSDIGDLLASPLEDNALSNHAYDQAVALFLIAEFFATEPKSKDLRALALYRLERELEYAFTEDGVHVENSPSYHHGMILNISASLQRVLTTSPHEAIERYLASLKRTVPYLAWMIRPDGKVPPIGDSEEKMVSTQLAKTLNPDGFPSTFSGMRVFGGGYGIWKSDQPKYHMTLKSCLHGRFHRHDDDCSITLWANGRNLIVDSGLLYYQEQDRDRIYVRSAAAHSGFELPGKRASRNFFSSTAHRSKVFKVEPDRAKAVMGMYGNITASRTVHVQDQVATLTDQFSPSCIQHGVRVHFIVDGDWVPELKGQFIVFTDEKGVQWSLNGNGCSDDVEVVETFTSPLKNQKRNALRVTFLPVSEEVKFSINFGGV